MNRILFFSFFLLATVTGAKAQSSDEDTLSFFCIQQEEMPSADQFRYEFVYKTAVPVLETDLKLEKRERGGASWRRSWLARSWACARYQ